jgi:phosphatidylserine decarboxylase
MKKYPHPIIAREGWPFIALALAAAGGIHAYAGFGAAAFPWLIVLFMVQFFRDPQRAIPVDPFAVISPADGRIVSVEKVRDPYLERDALKISVFMNVFNAHSNRIPVDGAVTKTLYFPGKFVNAELSKASIENERAVTCLRTPQGHDVTCVQVAGLIARRILCYAKEGQSFARGDRFGFIRFGPRAVVGDKVYATETVLASLQ